MNPSTIPIPDAPKVGRKRKAETTPSSTNSTSLLRSPQKFKEYEMFFLKNPVYYQLQNMTNLKKSKYCYQMFNITDFDVCAINDKFKVFNAEMQIENEAFINGKTAIFLNSAYPGDVIIFEDGYTWSIKLKIQGFKKSVDGKCSPIWTLVDCKLAFW